MMTSTHAVVGASLGAAVATVVPELSPAAVLVGFVGGALPDIDLVATHRRTTHFPVLAPLGGLLVTAVALVVGGTAALLALVFALAFAIHTLMDVFGGGVEPEPWLATSDRGVYNHVAGRWIAPRRWVRYAGAPEDLSLAVGAAVLPLASTAGPTRQLLVATLAVSACFALFRRRLSTISELVVDRGLED